MWIVWSPDAAERVHQWAGGDGAAGAAAAADAVLGARSGARGGARGRPARHAPAEPGLDRLVLLPIPTARPLPYGRAHRAGVLYLLVRVDPEKNHGEKDDEGD